MGPAPARPHWEGKWTWEPFLSRITVHCTTKPSFSRTQNRNGTCLTNNECSEQGGTQSGNCAAGYTKCCIVYIVIIHQSIISLHSLVCTLLISLQFRRLLHLRFQRRRRPNHLPELFLRPESEFPFSLHGGGGNQVHRKESGGWWVIVEGLLAYTCASYHAKLK